MKEFLDKLLLWLKDVLPSVVAFGGWVYSYMLRKVNIEKNKADKILLDKELLENKIEVEEKHKDKSNRDIVLDVADRKHK